jgi:hypothetical protein
VQKVAVAVSPVFVVHAGQALRFRDLRHSDATWLIDDEVPPNMVQRVMGHEHVSTTLQLYVRRTEHRDRIRQALNTTIVTLDRVWWNCVLGGVVTGDIACRWSTNTVA